MQNRHFSHVLLFLVSGFLWNAWGQGPVVVSDEFNGTLNSATWQVLAPMSDSRMTSPDGTATFFQRGTLVTRADMPAPIEIRGRFAFVGGTYDQFAVSLRSDGVLLSPYYQFQSNIYVGMNMRGGDDGNQTGQRNITLALGTSLVLTANFAFLSNSYYDFRIVDDGNRISLFLANSATPILSGVTNERNGYRIGLQNRGFVPWFPTYDNQVKLESFSVSVAAPAQSAPAIVSQPVSQMVVAGQSAAFSVVATGTAPLSYQWRKDGVAIAGATQSSLTVATALAGAAAYTVAVTNSVTTLVSQAATLTVRTANPGRLTNLSIRTSAGAGNGSLIVGFVLGGSGTSGSVALLTRAAGPALAQFGVTGTLPDPILSLFSSGRLTDSNDDWGGAAIGAVSSNVGAFAFQSGSKDSAIASSLVGGGYTAQVADVNGVAGVALVELYEASEGFSYARPRLVNVSARANAGSGGGTMIAGFVIKGETSVTVLVRGIGPGLAQFGVTGVLSNPKLTLYRDSAVVGINDNWSDVGAAAISSTASAVGAFALPANSLDAAILATLAPGSYTAQIVGADTASTAGIALVEIYEVP